MIMMNYMYTDVHVCGLIALWLVYYNGCILPFIMFIMFIIHHVHHVHTVSMVSKISKILSLYMIHDMVVRAIMTKLVDQIVRNSIANCCCNIISDKTVQVLVPHIHSI